LSEGLNFFVNLVVNGLVAGSIYSLISLPIVLIFKSSKVFNLAQGELVMMGGYLCLFMMLSAHLSIFLALFVTLILMFLLGFAIERVILRPMIGECFISVIMITLGLASILRGLVSLLWGTDTYVYPTFLQEVEVSIVGYHLSGTYLVSLGLCIILLILFFFFFKYSIFGIAIRATASDQIASMSMGISVKKVFGFTWAISAMLASP